MVVLGEPGQPGHGQVVVVLLDSEGPGPLNQPLDPGGRAGLRSLPAKQYAPKARPSPVTDRGR